MTPQAAILFCIFFSSLSLTIVIPLLHFSPTVLCVPHHTSSPLACFPTPFILVVRPCVSMLLLPWFLLRSVPNSALHSTPACVCPCMQPAVGALTWVPTHTVGALSSEEPPSTQVNRLSALFSHFHCHSLSSHLLSYSSSVSSVCSQICPTASFLIMWENVFLFISIHQQKAGTRH